MRHVFQLIPAVTVQIHHSLTRRRETLVRIRQVYQARHEPPAVGSRKSLRSVADQTRIGSASGLLVCWECLVDWSGHHRSDIPEILSLVASLPLPDTDRGMGPKEESLVKRKADATD